MSPRLIPVALALSTPALAQQPSVTITGPAVGTFHQGIAPVTGRVDNTSINQVRVNGVLESTIGVDVNFDGIADYQTFEVPHASVPVVGFNRLSPVHSVRVELIDPGTGAPLAADQIAYYDVTEFGATPQPRGHVHTEGASVRISQAGLDEIAAIATEEAELAKAQWIDPVVAELDRPGPEVDVDLPARLCTDLNSLGLTIDLFEVGEVDFGLSVGDFASVSGTEILLCIDGLSAEVGLDLDEVITGTPDIDGDGVPEPFLELDAVPDAVVARVATGPISGDASVTLDASIGITLAGLSGIPGLPFVPSAPAIVPLPIPCGATVSVASITGTLGLQIEPDASDARLVDARQPAAMSNVGLVGAGATMSGVCESMTPVADALVSGSVPLLERAASELIDEPYEGSSEPFVPTVLEEALEGVELSTMIAIGETGTLALDATLGAIDEDDDGIFVTIDANVSPVDMDTHAALVPPQPDAYRPDSAGAGFTADPYDLELALESSVMSQALHAAFSTGAFHRELSLLDELVDLGLPTVPSAPGLPLTPEALADALPILEDVVPAGTELVIRMGPALAPVAVVEDRSVVPYELAVSFYQYEVQVLQLGVGGAPDVAWLELVADFGADIELSPTPEGDVAVGMPYTEFALQVVSLHDPTDLVDFRDASVAAGFSSMVLGEILDHTTSTLGSLPLPLVHVPSLSGQPRAVTFDTLDLYTGHTAERMQVDVVFD